LRIATEDAAARAPEGEPRFRSQPVTRNPHSAILGGLSLVLVAGLVGGCAALFPKNPHKEGAERWGRVRGRIKLQLAKDQFEAGRIREAEVQLKEAVGLDPKSPDAQILLAKLNLEKGELIAAKAALDAAIQLNGTSAEIDYLHGVIAQRYGDLDAALAYYREASDRAPESAAYVAAQAETLAALGRLTEALELIDARQRDFERNATLRALAGNIHTLLGQYEEASDAYREAAGLAKDDVQLQLQLGVSLARAGRYQEAIAVLAPALAQKPDTPWSARLALGRAYLGRSDVSAARDVFRDAIRACANDAEPWTWLGRTALACGDLIVARQASEKATTLAPRDAAGWLLLGYVCERQKDYPSARTALEASLRLDPRDSLAHCLLGQVLEAQGRKADAVSHYRQAIEANAGCEWAEELLAAAETPSAPR
jgi:tetratricopeptide (TPR) repeat protein